MRVGIMKTDGGTHSVEDWATVTAAQIVNLDPSMTGGRLLAAQKLQIAVAEALVPHHQKHHDSELSGLASVGAAHYSVPPVPPASVIDAVVADVVACAKGTPWEALFASEAYRTSIRGDIETMFATHSDVERQHHSTSRAA